MLANEGLAISSLTTTYSRHIESMAVDCLFGQCSHPPQWQSMSPSIHPVLTFPLHCLHLDMIMKLGTAVLYDRRL